MKLGFIFLAALISNYAMADCTNKTGLAKTRCECFETMPEVENSERTCETNADCKVVADKCGGWATFNSGSIEKYKKLYEKILIPTKIEASKVSGNCKLKICRIDIKK